MRLREPTSICNRCFEVEHTILDLLICSQRPLDGLVSTQELPDVVPLDQLTINEYTPGVGLSAHIDTHSAFTGAILSLSLAGGCVMEFRKPLDVSTNTCSSSVDAAETPGEQGQAASSANCAADVNGAAREALDADDGAGMQRILVYLPPRALLVMGKESRYAW